MLEVILSCGKQPLLLEEFEEDPLGEVFLSTLKLTVLLSFYILAQWSPSKTQILKLSGSNRTNL